MHSTNLLSMVTALLLAAAAAAGEQACKQRFTLIDGFLCIKSRFVHAFNEVTSEQQCAILCWAREQCRAFSLSNGPCQLYLFDKCSKSVKDCGCSRRGRVFVKQQPGLPAGLLCPPGYGDDLCGVKYRVYKNLDRSWLKSREKCESDSGLVIMADVTSSVEMKHVESMYSLHAGGNTMWLGGLQEPGSVEPKDGWYWVGCNITVDNSLWNYNEPNDNTPNENVIVMHPGYSKLVDIRDNVNANRLLCECVSPFD